ncbi:hypothetical protein G6F60_015659 [Rhizopus arrhizus]|nr:hypothetical protein G6F60_015659 [Rhizopus arrhizus]
MNSGKRRWSAVQLSSTAPTRIDASPTVTMNTDIGASPSMARIVSRPTSAPKAPDTTTAPTIASQIGHSMPVANA